MTNCQCKGKDNEIFCKCENTPFTLLDGSPTPFMPIILTTNKITVTEKDWVAKVDTMVDLQASVGNGEVVDVNYVVERITGGVTTTLCSYNILDERDNQSYTLTPNNTVCDHPPLGCHMYRLSILDNGTGASVVTLDNSCRCINVTTFQKGEQSK
ncbi:hypothetical protein [Cytobacillus sp. IB215316]|uniref:hypothetical protein n=2 Tax=Bacillaceae TaxID=186817 RepID=UPI002A0D1CAA|nr:hypothetical protein [Cytobacillus sp. IB215316]MDX8360373.1 hypothetical protein [Cytobacillus sp. IB215316]